MCSNVHWKQKEGGEGNTEFIGKMIQAVSNE